jgi:hypothetical protein
MKPAEMTTVELLEDAAKLCRAVGPVMEQQAVAYEARAERLREALVNGTASDKWCYSVVAALNAPSSGIEAKQGVPSGKASEDAKES